MSQHERIHHNKHEMAPGRPSVEDIVTRIEAEDPTSGGKHAKHDYSIEEKYNDTLDAMNDAFRDADKKYSMEDQYKSELADFDKIDMPSPEGDAVTDQANTDDEEDRSPQVYRMGAGEIAPEITNPEKYEAKQQREQQKQAFLSALDEEFAKMVEAGTISQEYAKSEKKHAEQIKATDGLFSSNPVEDAIRFAHEGLDENGSVEDTLDELDDVINPDESHETDAPDVEEVSQTLDELDLAVNGSDDSTDDNHGETWSSTETGPLHIIEDDEDEEDGDDDYEDDERKSVFARVRERYAAAKERKTVRTAEKQSLRERFAARKEQREMNSFLNEQSGIFGFLISDWSRKRREKRHKKLAKASRQALEHSDEQPQPHY